MPRLKRHSIRACLALSAAAAIAGKAEADIAISVAGPMTGQYAPFGAQMKAGAEQAVADLNAAGGVLGEPVVLEIGDDQCDPNEAVAIANQMAGKDIALMAGHFCSIASISAADVYAKEKIVMISPASPNPALTDERAGPGVFRVSGRDDQQGAVAGRFLAESFSDGKVAILHDNTAYGKGLADQTKKAMNAAGKTETMYEAYVPGEDDYSSIVSKLKAANIDVVYVGGYYPEAGLIKVEMENQGVDTPLIAGDALMTEEYWSITGDAGAGTLVTFSPDPRKNPGAADVVAEFRAKGIEPEGYVLYTYAAIQAWAQAVEKAGSTDFEAVVEALAADTFDTVIGTFEFDEKGDVSLPGYVFYEWKDGSYDYY